MVMNARYPRRKRRLVPLRFRTGSSAVHGRWVRLSLAQGLPALWPCLARPLPYLPETVCAVTLLHEHGRLVDVPAGLPVVSHAVDPGPVAGVDLGIIHPSAVATGHGEALLVSGRAIRAEHRLRQAEARHRRRLRRAHHEAAGQVIDFTLANGVGTLIVGDPKGICEWDAGRRQNPRLLRWRRTHLLQALTDKAARHGIRAASAAGCGVRAPAVEDQQPQPPKANVD
jgi:transposase